MPSKKAPRKGSLQFWPRKRAQKALPRTNWDVIDTTKILKGFIGYKAGMLSAAVKDNTEHSMTQGKNIAMPVTILECPKMKIFAVRFYKNKVAAKDVIVSVEKELKRKVKLPKKAGNLDSIKLEDFDDIKIIAYSLVKAAKIKTTPDVVEIGLTGSLEDKMNYVKENLDKELSVVDIFAAGDLIDVRGLTKGKGLSGPVKRFGITLKSHKSEKGVRRPGNIGPWHPARVTFRIPMAGQLGMFTRAVYNNNIVGIGKADEPNQKLKAMAHYGDVTSDYVIVRGSLMGSQKRQLLLTAPLRPSKKQIKKSYELIELR